MSRNVRGACALYYSYQVKGADGKIKVPFRRRMAHSFLTAYITGLYLRMVGPTTQNLTDTGGVSRTIHRNTMMDCNTAAGNATEGLVVGTGTNAVTITDSKLQTQISHGTSAGTLDYGASVVNLPVSTATTTTLQLTRVFANSSGGSITVREIGIYATMRDSEQGAGNRQMCIVRDTVTITLSNGDQLTLNYILSTTA
jgi:hypothetical protein